MRRSKDRALRVLGLRRSVLDSWLLGTEQSGEPNAPSARVQLALVGAAGASKRLSVGAQGATRQLRRRLGYARHARGTDPGRTGAPSPKTACWGSPRRRSRTGKCCNPCCTLSCPAFPERRSPSGAYRRRRFVRPARCTRRLRLVPLCRDMQWTPERTPPQATQTRPRHRCPTRTGRRPGRRTRRCRTCAQFGASLSATRALRVRGTEKAAAAAPRMHRTCPSSPATLYISSWYASSMSDFIMQLSYIQAQGGAFIMHFF